MDMAIRIFTDPQDMNKLHEFFYGMTRRAARSQLLPILKTHFEPVVAMERSIVSSHSISGALEASLVARSGSGDRKEVISAFSAPTATRKQLITNWGRGRKQQKKWAAKIERKGGRQRVFYGPMAEKGHRIVRRRADGTLFDTGKRTRPIHFARGAMEALGEQQSEKAAEAVMTHICGF